jgi:hypothetical protein
MSDLQVNTTHQLEMAHTLAGRAAEAAAMAQTVERKMADITQVHEQSISSDVVRIAV